MTKDTSQQPADIFNRSLFAGSGRVTEASMKAEISRRMAEAVAKALEDAERKRNIVVRLKPVFLPDNEDTTLTAQSQEET